MDLKVTSSIRKNESPDIFTGDMDIVRLTFICYIDDILHFTLDVTDYITFLYSYTDKNMYFIEITDANNKLLKLEYDSKEKWEMVLKQLDSIL